MTKALSTLRALFIILAFGIMTSASAVTSIGEFLARGAVSQWTDNQVVDVFLTSYYTNGFPNQTINTTLGYHTISARFPNDVELKPYIETRCKTATAEGDLCANWNDYLENLRDTLVYSEPGFSSSYRVVPMGSCTTTVRALTGYGSTDPVKIRFEWNNANGENVIGWNSTNQAVYQRNWSYSEMTNRAGYQSEWNSVRSTCIKPSTFMVWAQKNYPKATIAIHGRISINRWITMLSNSGTTIGLLGMFSLGAGAPDPNAPCNGSICPGYNPDLDNSGPPVINNPSTPACTKPDGTTSGNPYDCSPSDQETSCKIIDLICAGKKLFIPRKSFLEEKMKDGIGFNVNLPVTVADKWDFDIKLAGATIPVGARFDTLNWDEKTKDLWRFYVWWGNFLFLLAFIGVPFMSRKAVAEAARDSTEGAALRQAEADLQAEQEYRKLRDTPWDKY